jgi:acyl carrier protein
MQSFFDLLDKLMESPSLAAVYRLSMQRWAGAPAHEFSDGKKIGRLTYAEYDAQSRRAAAMLSTHIASEKGAFIALAMENKPQWGVWFWGLVLAGYCPLLIGPKEEPQLIEHVMREAGAKALVTDAGLSVPFAQTIHAALPDAEGPALPPLPEDGDVAGKVAFVTSGTTGEPKICVHDGVAICHQINAARRMPDRTKDIMYPDAEGPLKNLALLPFHHIFGFVAVFLWYTFFGRTIVYPENLAPQTLFDTCKRHRVTHIFAPPLLWNNVYRVLKGRKGGVPQGPALRILKKKTFGDDVRFMISGGGMIAPEVIALVNEIGYPLYNGYGATEIGITSVCLDPGAKGRSDGNVGEPLLGVHYRISPFEGYTNTGELLIESPYLYAGTLSGGAFRPREEGAYRTGDVCRKNKRGRLWVLGRVDDMIQDASGEKVIPSEIEMRFCEIAQIEHCLVFDEAGGHLSLIVQPEAGADTAALLSSIAVTNAALPAHKNIHKVYLSRDPFPLVRGFKVQRAALLRRFAENPGAFATLDGKGAGLDFLPAPLSPGEADALSRVRDVFAAVLNLSISDVGDDADFIVGLGGDSLDYMNMIVKVEEAFGRKIPAADFMKLRTARAFAAYLKPGGAST